MGSRLSAGFFAFLVLVPALLVVHAGVAGAGWNFPEPFSRAQIDSLARVHGDEGALILFHLTTADIRYDPERECIRGEMVECREVLIFDSGQLADAGRVVVMDSPLVELKEFGVEIVPHNERKTSRLDRGGLDWTSFTPSSGGVVSLDREVSRALVPGLQPGDRLRIKSVYRFESHHGVPTKRLGNWALPCVLSGYDVILPADHELIWAGLGPEPLQERLDYSSTSDESSLTHRWRLWDLPRCPDNSGGRSDDEGQVTIIPHIVAAASGITPTTFAAGADWGVIARNYRNRIAGTLDATPELQNLAARLTADCLTPGERIDVLYGHVQDTTRYLGLFEGLEGIIPEPAAAVMANGYGDCKGLGSFLIALLRSVDIPAWPALVRTGHLGPLATEIPNPMQFNHWIVWADDGGDGIWIDATLKGCPAGAIDPQDAASPVLLLRPGHEGLHEIPFAAWQPGSLLYDVQGTLAADNSLELAVTLTADGAAGIRLRRQSLGLSAEELGDARDHRLRPVSIPMRAAQGTVAPGDGDRSAPVTWSLNSQSGRPLPGNGQVVFLPYVMPPLPRFEQDPDPDLMPDRRETWSIALPNGWSVEPDSLAVQTADLTWRRRVWQEGSNLRLERDLIWNHRLDPDVDTPARPQELTQALKNAVQGERGYITIKTGP